jgi:predicted dehydrogenase
VIRTGLIGYGYWGPNLARNLAETAGVELCAIADARAERRESAERRHRGVATHADAAGLLARTDLDAVVIATPLATHYQLAQQAIDSGKHVLVEKPLARSSREVDDLAERADRRGVCLMVDHTFVHSGAVRKIRALIDSGDLGELMYLDSVRINLGLFQQDSNVMWDLAAHDLAILDYLIDERPIAVSANGSAITGYRHPTIAYVSVHFASGFLAHFHVSWLAPAKIRHMLLGGRKRMIRYDDLEPSDKILVYDKGVDFTLDQHDDTTRQQILVSYRIGDTYAPNLNREEPLTCVVREFASAIADGRPPSTGAASGRYVVSLLEAADQSLQQGGARVAL